MIVQVSCTVCMVGIISVHVINVHVSIFYCKLLASIKIQIILHLLKLDKLYFQTYCNN